MNKAHTNINWENYPSDSTPLNESNLNKMDVSIDEIDNRVINLDTTKLDKVTAATMVKDVSYNESTGIFTVKYLNGATYFLDTKLEKLAVNFSYDATAQQLIITLDDGTVQQVDLSALITQYEFLNTDTVAFSIDSTGKVSALVKDGSITEDKLQPNYLADIKLEVSKAQASEKAAATSEKNAASSAKEAESFAHGGTGARENEDTDNAKYYYEQSKATCEDFAKKNVTGVKGAAETAYRTGDVDIDLKNIASRSTGGAFYYEGNVDELLYNSQGAYWVKVSESTGTHPSDDISYYQLEVIAANSAVVMQIAHCFDDCATYYRMYTNNKWYDWTQGISEASATKAGLMSVADKEKLNNLSSTYSKTELDNLLSEKSDTNHNHDSRYLQKTAVVNNNVTTEAGYALDARQANPNVSGSLGAQISSLNTALETHNHTWSAIIDKPSIFPPSDHNHSGLVKYIDKQLTTLSNGNCATGFVVLGTDRLIGAVSLWNNVTIKGMILSDSQYYLSTDIYNNTIYVRLFYI